MKDLLQLAVIQLIAAIAVYLILFLMGALRSLISWMIVLAAIAFVLNYRRRIRYPWWLEKIWRKLRDLLPRYDGGKEK